MRVYQESIQHLVHKVTGGDLIPIQRLLTCEGMDMCRENFETLMEVLGCLILLHMKVMQGILGSLISCHLKRVGTGLGSDEGFPKFLGICEVKIWSTSQLVHSSSQEAKNSKVEVPIKLFMGSEVVWINGVVSFPGVDEVPHCFTYKPKIILVSIGGCH